MADCKIFDESPLAGDSTRQLRDDKRGERRPTLRESCAVAIIGNVPNASTVGSVQFAGPSRRNPPEASGPRSPHSGFRKRGQVAQVVERSPEKAGVGGSTPSLATMFSIT